MLALLTFSPLIAADDDADRSNIESLLRAKSTAQARRLIEPLIAARPQEAKLRAYLALSYVHENRWESAAAAYAEALRLAPEEDDYRLLYGWSLYYLGRLESAREQFELFLAGHAEFVDAIFAMGLIDFDQDRLDDAEARFKKVIVLSRARGDDRRHAMARARMADIYLRHDNPSRARLELKQALELDPENSKALFKMSRVLQLLGKVDEAAAVRAQFDALRDRGADGAGHAEFPETP